MSEPERVTLLIFEFAVTLTVLLRLLLFVEAIVPPLNVSALVPRAELLFATIVPALILVVPE